MDVFNMYHSINESLKSRDEQAARNELIKLLAHHDKENIEYTPLLNHLIRATGLYLYMDINAASWEERLVYDLFKVDIAGKPIVLHREQSHLLKLLLSGENIAVSAPTSFGKSFIIDAFLSIKKPAN